MTYKVVEWTQDLDLSVFYAECLRRGFMNNSSQKVMIDTFKAEGDVKAWILYNDNTVIGASVLHKLPILGVKSYRVGARTASFSEHNPKLGLLTRKGLITHLQSLTAQFFIPAQINYLGHDTDMFISSNDSPVATQRLVHRVWCPEMQRMGLLSEYSELEYRGHVQKFWKVNSREYMQRLEMYPKWDQL